MLVALFLSTILLFLLWWLTHTLIIEFRTRNNRETLLDDVNAQKKPIRTRKTMKSVNRDSDLIFNSQNSPLNRRKEGPSNEPVSLQKKSQRQNEEEQNKLELRISSNCSDTGDQQKQQDLEDYIQQSYNQRYSSQKNISRQESNEEPSYTHSSRIMASPSQYLNGMTTVIQLSEEYRGTERDPTLGLGQSEHMTNINIERSEHQSEPNHEFAGTSFTGIQSSGFNQMKYNRAKTQKDNDSKIPESLMSMQKNKNSQNNAKSEFQIKEGQPKENFSEIKLNNFTSSTPPQKGSPHSQLKKQVSEERVKQNSKDNQQDSQKQEGQKNADKQQAVDQKQADSKEEANKQIHLNKQNCPPEQSQQLKITEDQFMRSENSPSPSSQKIKLDSNMDSFYDLTLSRDDIRQQSKASKPQSDVPLILVHETFNEIMKEKPFIYKYDKNNLPETVPHEQRFIPNSNMSIKQLSKHSLSERSEAVYKKDLTKLLEQIDSFFMNNSSAQKSNEKNLQSNQYQLATQNYDFSSGAYYYSGQKSQSDIIKQSFHPKDFRKAEQIDTQKQYGTESIQKDSRGDQSNLNISSKKENSVSLEVQSRKQTIRTSKNLSRPPAPPMRKAKKKKKVSKTEKFKLKHDGEEDEVEESDYPYDQDDDLDNNSLISYNKIQEDIITQLEAKIKKLMNTVSLVQNKHDGLVKQLYHDKEVRDSLVKKCQQLEEEKKIRQKLLNEGLNSNFLSDEQLEPFASYIRQIDRCKQQNQKLKQENKQLKKGEEQDKQQKYMLSEKCRDLQEQQQQQKNNFQVLIQGYEEKIKTQGQLIEESLKKIRQLEGLNGSDEQIDEYQYYVDSHDSFQGFQDRSIQGRSSQRRKKLSMRKSDLQKLKIDSSKKSTPTSSFRVKENRLLQIAQQVSDLQNSYNKAKQEANNYKQQLEASQRQKQELKQSLLQKEEEYLSKLRQMQEQLQNINLKADQYLEKYENILRKYEELKQQMKNKQNEGRISNDKKNTDVISTASHQNTTENEQILKLYHEFKENNENITAELEFCQQQIQLMFQNQKALRQENSQLTAQLKNKKDDQQAKPIKHNRISSGQTPQIKNSREHYEEVKKKYLEMKKEREKGKINAVDYHYPRIISSPGSGNDIRSHSQENNEQRINPISSWRRSHAFVQHFQQPLHRQHESYYTSPKSQKNISISSRKSDLHKQKQVYRTEKNYHLFKLNSDFLRNPNHPYIQFMNTVLLSHKIRVKNSYKIFSSIKQEHINKTSLKLAISNIQNILFLCKIKDENNKNKIIGGFSKLALISDSHHKHISRRNINLDHQKQAFGILFDYSNFLFYSSRKQHHSHTAVASFDKNILVWGYNELFLDTDQPNILYANFNESYEAANNIYWGSKEQASTFVYCMPMKNEIEDRKTNVKWVPIEGFQIFALSS